MKKHFGRCSSRSVPFTIFMGIVISLFALLILSVAASFFAYKSANPTAKTGLISTIVLVLSGCLCGVFVSKFKGEGGIRCAFLTASAFAVILVASKLIFSGSFSAYSLINATSYLASTLLCAYLARQKQRKRRY